MKLGRPFLLLTTLAEDKELFVRFIFAGVSLKRENLKDFRFIVIAFSNEIDTCTCIYI